MNYYDYIKIIPDALPEPFIELTKELITAETSSPALVGYDDETTDVNLEYRNTNWFPIPEFVAKKIELAVTNLYELEYRKIYKKNVVKVEAPQLLEYPVGGKYDMHNDADDWIDGKPVRKTDRDVSILAYLNDDYEGGELEFNFFGITIKPKKGMIIAFPSYYEFTHQVHPVTKGTRYTLVTWIETNERIYERE